MSLFISRLHHPKKQKYTLFKMFPPTFNYETNSSPEWTLDEKKNNIKKLVADKSKDIQRN